MHHAPLGADGPLVSAVCFGTSPLGGMPQIYGHDVDEDTAVETIAAFLSTPALNFIDTSNEYGRGESERRIGLALRQSPPRDDLVIATKVDPAPGTTDFSAGRTHRSVDESLERLGVGRVDVLYLHDPERGDFDAIAGTGGAVEAMVELKRAGVAGLIGVAAGDIPTMERYLELGVFDVMLNHNQFTVLDRSADGFIDRTLAAGATFVNAAPYASGLLAKPSSVDARYQYRAPSNAVRARVERVRALCDDYGVTLPTVALQFSTRDARITSTVVGVSTPERVAQLVENAEAAIPDGLWADLEGIVREFGDE